MLIQNKKKGHTYEVTPEEWDNMGLRQRAYKVLSTGEEQTLQDFQKKILIPREVKDFDGGKTKKAASGGKSEKTNSK